MAVLLVCIAAGIIFFQLGTGQLRDYDEGIYASVARSMSMTGDMVDLTYQFQDWFEKPPLMFYLVSSTYRAFGVSTFTTRVIPALMAVGCVILLFLLGRSFGSRATGLLSGALLVTLPHFIASSRQFMLDVPVTFFNLAFLFLFVVRYVRRSAFLSRSQEQLYLFGMAFMIACGVLTKGPEGLFYPGGVVAFLLWQRTVRQYWRELLKVAIVSIVVIVPWYLVQSVRHGAAFWSQHLGYHVLQRAVGIVDSHLSVSNSYYSRVLFWGAYPWSYLVIAAGCYAAFLAIRHKRWQSRLLLCALGASLLPPLVMATKLDQYLVPLYPLAALLAADSIVALRLPAGKSWQSGRKYFPVVPAICLAVLIGFRLHLPPVMDCAHPLAYNISRVRAQTSLVVDQDVGLHPTTFFELLEVPRLSAEEIRTRFEQGEIHAAIVPAGIGTEQLLPGNAFILLQSSQYDLITDVTGLDPGSFGSNGTYDDQGVQRTCYSYLPATLYNDPFVY